MTYQEHSPTIVLVYANGRLLALEWAGPWPPDHSARSKKVSPTSAPLSLKRLSSADLGDTSSGSGVTDLFGDEYMLSMSSGLEPVVSDGLFEPEGFDNVGEISE